jgi:hypothetical protein
VKITGKFTRMEKIFGSLINQLVSWIGGLIALVLILCFLNLFAGTGLLFRKGIEKKRICWEMYTPVLGVLCFYGLIIFFKPEFFLYSLLLFVPIAFGFAGFVFIPGVDTLSSKETEILEESRI